MMNNKEKIARRVALEFRDGDLVNLGAGLPGLAAQYLDKDITVFMQTENGIVGAGPYDGSEPVDPYRTDASENQVSIVPGGCAVDSCTSFGIIRGGHLQYTVLGTFQVDEEGSLANWIVSGGKFVGMGGAMDLVSGAKTVIVATEHCDKNGNPKILKKCTFPLTGRRCVKTIITELCYLSVTSDGLVMREIAPGVTAEEVIAKTEASLIIDKENLRIMSFEKRSV
jgi:3-oxoacid CoA-transferase B subunit